MGRKVRITLVAAGLGLSGAAAPAASHAALKAKTTIKTSAGSTRIVVVLSSTSAVPARRRPTKVSVKRSGKTYVLSRARGSAWTAAKTFGLGTWRSAAYRGAAATKLKALAGKSVSVVVTSRAGTTTFRSTVAKLPPPPGGTPPPPPPPAPPPPPPGPTGPTPLFTPPAQALTGEAAFNSIKQYFLNSEFSDCAQGSWPVCQVEQRYEHGPQLEQEYHRCTPVSGSDINSISPDGAQVSGVEQATDGSWKIEYYVNNHAGFYHWEVATTGIVVGYYQFNAGPPEQLGPLVWRQPAKLGSCYT